MNDLLAYFDILGFRSFCLNNAAEGAANEVLSTIESLDTIIPGILNGMRRDSPLSTVLPDLRWLIFSDTIFVSVSHERGRTQEARISRLFLFLFACAALQRSMFEYGLPLRGVIHVGPFVATQRSFAGRAIIEAYELVQQLDVSACVLTPEARQLYADTIPDSHRLAPFLRGLLIPYDVPVKERSTCRLSTVNWFTIRWHSAHRVVSDIHQFVSGRFCAHNKAVEGNAAVKADNTERLFNYWDSAVPGVVLFRNSEQRPVSPFQR
jgi:hypothetical protein